MVSNGADGVNFCHPRPFYTLMGANTGFESCAGDVPLEFGTPVGYSPSH